MKVVSEGYSFPFRELPPSKIMLNNKTARDNMTFVKEEVCKLLKKRLCCRGEGSTIYGKSIDGGL